MTAKVKPTVGPLSFRASEHEPNKYYLVDDSNNHWLAVIQFNGELMGEKQQANMEHLVKLWNQKPKPKPRPKKPAPTDVQGSPRDVYCEECGALPGEHCVKARGGKRIASHMARVTWFRSLKGKK